MAQEPDIDVGAITEALNNKTDTDGQNVLTSFGEGIFGANAAIPVISAGTSNGIWYRIYADGWLVQAGITAYTGSYGSAAITFPYAYASTPVVTGTVNTDPSVFSNLGTSITIAAITDLAGSVAEVSTTGFKINLCSSHFWIACGYKAAT
jgi:hypothetical protein